MKHACAIATVGLCLFGIHGSLHGGDADVIRNGDFARGARYWDGFGVTEGKEVAAVDGEGGGKVLLLKRKIEGAKVAARQLNIRLNPQTLYELVATGWGDAPAAVKLHPSSRKDKDFSALSMSWATSSAPFELADEPRTMTFTFDSGLKTSSVILSFCLTGKKTGAFRVAGVALVEEGSSRPDPKETVILHLGDSITSTSYLPFHQRVDRVLQEMIEKQLPGVKTRQLNLGVDGEWIGQLLDTKRYQKVVRENYPKVDVVIIRYGANDTRMYKVPEFKKRLRDLCTRLKRDYPAIRIILGTGPYAKGLNWGNTRQYGPYWQAIREVAAEDGYALVDVYKRFEKEATFDTARKPRDLHPSPFGVRLIAEEEFKVLRTVLETPEK